MSFSNLTEPQPDVAVIKGGIDDFTHLHPKIAALIVEVSDATLRYDRTKKASLYAKNKIQEYWIVNVKDKRLEVFRRPIKDYFAICDSYFQAVKQSTPQQIETIDMARRGIHNEAAELLKERLVGKIDIDFDTARRLFTLICVLHIKG